MDKSLSDALHARHRPRRPLSHYLTDHPTVPVRFHCDGCQASHEVPMLEIEQLRKALGRSDALPPALTIDEA